MHVYSLLLLLILSFWLPSRCSLNNNSNKQLSAVWLLFNESHSLSCRGGSSLAGLGAARPSASPSSFCWCQLSDTSCSCLDVVKCGVDVFGAAQSYSSSKRRCHCDPDSFFPLDPELLCVCAAEKRWKWSSAITPFINIPLPLQLPQSDRGWLLKISRNKRVMASLFTKISSNQSYRNDGERALCRADEQGGLYRNLVSRQSCDEIIWHFLKSCTELCVTLCLEKY